MRTMKNSLSAMGWALHFAAAASLIWIPLALALTSSGQASAQESAQESDRPVTASAPVVPQQVRYAGKLAARAGETVEAEFRIYAVQQGGEPLWTETQQLPVGLDGSYSVLLGAASPAGLPQAVFAGGAARWLGISVDRSAEQERVLLSSVPYAMKSADAESLSGHAASEFVTQDQLAALAATGSAPAAGPVQPNTSGPITGSGTVNNLALFTGANAIGNANMVQSGTSIGINVGAPASTLDVGGGATVRGTFVLPALGTATTTNGFGSNVLKLGASSYSSTIPGPVAQNFALLTVPTGNNTAGPSASLELLFGSGTGGLNATGFSIANTGRITFAAGQAFPGTGAITSIAATSPLTGGGASGAVTLGLNNAALETTLNAVYPQLASANAFHGNQTINGGLTVTSALNAASATLTGNLNVAQIWSSSTINTRTPFTATATSAPSSPQYWFGASAYNSSTSAAVSQNLGWQAVVTGNNTATPSANLVLLSSTGTNPLVPTGMSISAKGLINWAPGQTFPITGTGGGTITGITTSSPLTGSGTSGSVALGLNESTLTSDIAPAMEAALLPAITPSLETTFDSRYALLSGGNVFSSYLEAFQTSGPGNAALLGWGSTGSVGTFGDSDTGYGIQGESTSGHGVYAQVTTPAAGSSGILGFTGISYSTIYTAEAGIANAGIWADNSAAGTGVPVSLFATGDDVYGEAIVTNGADYPALFVDNSTGTAGEFQAATGYGVSASTSSGTAVYASTSGTGDGVEGYNSSTAATEAGVLGVANTTSVTYGTYNIYAGVWGDSGTSSTTVAPAWAIGVLGTADDGHAGVFLNNSTGWSTLYVSNGSTGGTGLFKTLMASSSDGACGIGSGSLSCTGQIKSLVSAGNGARTVETYAVQSPENWMEDFGSGQLEKGVAVVRIDPAFAETVTGDASYHVFLTPNGDSKGLYVISKTPTTFEVRESGGGTSSLSFDFRIVAKRRGFETQRLVDVTERYNTEMKAASVASSSGVRHKPAVLARSPLHEALSAHPRRLTPGRTPMRHTPLVRPASETRTASRP